jgi:hypothetical protein
LAKEQGGFGRSWKKAGEPPVVERSDPAAGIDETEETNRHAVAVSSEFESQGDGDQDAAPRLDPDKQVQDELDTIFSELATFQSIGGGRRRHGGQPPGPGEPAGGGATERRGGYPRKASSPCKMAAHRRLSRLQQDRAARNSRNSARPGSRRRRGGIQVTPGTRGT